MALKVMRVYGQPWHKSFYRFWYLGHKSKTYHRLWWLLGAVSLSPPGRQNYSIGCSSVLGAGRSSPRDRLISIANNKVYHVLHPHQKNTFFWHFTWILNYTVDCPSQHWMRKKNSTLSSLKCLPDNWAKKKKKCNWTSKKSLETFYCPWTSRLSNFSDAFIEAISIYSAGFKKEMIAILNTLDLSFWLCKMSQNFVETDNTSVFGS